MSENKGDAACCHHSPSLYHSVHTALICPRRLCGMSSIHNTHTHMRVSRLHSCSAMWAAVTDRHPLWSALTASSPSFRCHRAPVELCSGNLYQTVGAAWACAGISAEREENLLHAGGGRTGYEVRRCESKKEKKKCDWQNVGEDRCRWDKWQQVGDRNRKTGDVDGEKKMMSKWEEESEKEQHLAFERNIVVISFVLVTTACSGGGCFPP